MARSEKILVVDDENGIRWLLLDVLSGKGFEVSIAKDGLEALDQLEDNNFDLVITDMNMPRLDGIEMLKGMKKAGRKEKVIIMSANPLDQSLLDGDMPRIVGQVQKPIRIDVFLDVVAAAIAAEEKTAKMKSRQAAGGGRYGDGL